jgi:hypothetical protein
LTGSGKRSRILVATTCVLILIARTAHTWWLALPSFADAPPFWLAAAAVLALGGLVLLLFLLALRSPGLTLAATRPVRDHG